MKRRISAVLVVMAVTACGGSTSLTPGESSSCTATLSGAVTGTFDCKPATTAWGSSNNQGGFAIAVQQAGTTPGFSVGIGWTGEPQTIHYKSSDTGAQGGVVVTTGSGATTQIWAGCASNSGQCGQVIGSYDLNFTSVSNAVSASGGKAYNTEGSLTATLQPLTGQTGNVTVSVTF
jgi:hypothetical protein